MEIIIWVCSVYYKLAPDSKVLGVGREPLGQGAEVLKD